MRFFSPAWGVYVCCASFASVLRDAKHGFIHAASVLVRPPVDFTPALYAGLHLVLGATFIFRSDLFAYVVIYAAMAAWWPAWVWGALSVTTGLIIAAASKGPLGILRAAMFSSTLILSCIAYALIVGPVGWGAFAAVISYMAFGSARCFTQLGRRGR